MKILIVNNQTKYLQELKDLLTRGSFNFDLIDIFELHENFNLDKYNCIILTGSQIFPAIETNRNEKVEMDLIKNSKIPVIGICFGFELIARAFEGTLTLSDGLVKEEKEIEIISNDEIFTDVQNIVYASENHRFVLDKLNNHIIGLAKSVDGYEIIRVKGRPIWGFQFHPELDTREPSGKKIFTNLLKHIQEIIDSGVN